MSVETYIFGRPATSGQLFLVGFLLGCLFLFCAVVFLYAYRQFCTEQQQQELIRQFQEDQAHYYNYLLGAGNSMRILRHDLNNHLETVQFLMTEEPGKAAEYLNEVYARLQVNPEQRRRSLLDFVLGECRQKARRADCRLELCVEEEAAGHDPILLGLVLAAFTQAAGEARLQSCIVLHIGKAEESCCSVRYMPRRCPGERHYTFQTLQAIVCENGYSLKIYRENRQQCLTIRPGNAALQPDAEWGGLRLPAEEA